MFCRIFNNPTNSALKISKLVNLLDLNIHSETFFAELCNLIFDLKLTNINALKHNTEGIDLIDNTNKVVVQVSSTCSKAKINSSLSKDIFKQYSD